MPNVEAIRAWVEDLRSGEYHQTAEMLSNGYAYCCLGVACGTYRKATGVGEWRETDAGLEFFAAPDDHDEAMLPDDVLKWLGMEEPDPVICTGRSEDDDWESCSVLNDRHKWTFLQIAGALERTYLTPEQANQ